MFLLQLDLSFQISRHKRFEDIRGVSSFFQFYYVFEQNVNWANINWTDTLEIHRVNFASPI